MLQNCNAFGNTAACAAVVAPGRGNPERAFFGGLALGIDKPAAGLDTQLRHNAGREQRVVRFENADIHQGF